MILGIGLDVVELVRIAHSLERFGERFLRRVLTAKERSALPQAAPVPFLAARFAAKEAAVKALGTGFAHGITLLHVEVQTLPSGAPRLVLLGPALVQAQQMGVRSVHVSLTHGRDIAAATVILEGAP